MTKFISHTLMLSIVLTSACSAAQTAPAPAEQTAPFYLSRLRDMAKKAKNVVLTFAKGANDTAHWHTTMKTVKQSNPELYERIKTETPLFFDWATHSKWQRRWKNLLHVVGPVTIAGLLFSAGHALSVLKMHPEAFGEDGWSDFADKNLYPHQNAAMYALMYLGFSLVLSLYGFIAASYFSQDAPLYIKDTLKPIFTVLAGAMAGDLAGLVISHYTTPSDFGSLYEKWKQEVARAKPQLAKDNHSFETRAVSTVFGGIVGFIATIVLLRKQMLKKHQELKEQEAQVTQWLNAAGITLNKGTSNDA